MTPPLKLDMQLIAALKRIDPQLGLLGLLTAEGVKPISRWEKPLGRDGVVLLERLGLHVRPIRRTVQTGAVLTETLFGRCRPYLEAYTQCFDNTPVDKSANTVRVEGFLFGFPPCCVEAYIRQPYSPNDLAPDDQKILFHWACRGCKITPLLLPVYHRIHEQVESL